MSRSKKKTQSRPVFDAIRKPVPPPGQKFGDDKPEERAHPSLRRTKHKKKLRTGDANGDL